MENWKAVEGFEGLYEVSDLGRVRSLYNGSIRRSFMKKTGYIGLMLTKDKTHKNYLVHRLVARAFCPGYRDGLVVNHIDADRSNNHFSNLEWVTPQENNRDTVTRGAYNGRPGQVAAKLKNEIPVEMLDITTEEVLAKFPSMTSAFKQTGINKCSIGQACRGHIRTAGGYKWRKAQ